MALQDPQRMRPEQAAALQLQFGNVRTAQVIYGSAPSAAATRQPTLHCGPIADRFEGQANRNAEQVGRGASQTASEGTAHSLVQRSPGNSRPESGQRPLDAKTESSILAARGGGRSLDETVRRSMERSLGAGFGDVRVHADGQADTLSRSLQARAFTVGGDIFFRQGQYHPGSAEGRRLLAHELTHVVQQGAAGHTGRVQRHAPGVVQRAWWNPFSWATERKDALTNTREEDPLFEGADLAEAAHRTAQIGQGATVKSSDDYSKLETFTNTPGVSQAIGGIKVASSLIKTGTSIADIHHGRKNLQSTNRFKKNVGALQVQQGAQDLPSALVGGSEGTINKILAPSKVMNEIPILDVVSNYMDAGIKGKKAIEDSATAGRLQTHQRTTAKSQKYAMDASLDAPAKERRYDQFKQHYDIYKPLKDTATTAPALQNMLPIDAATAGGKDIAAKNWFLNRGRNVKNLGRRMGKQLDNFSAWKASRAFKSGELNEYEQLRQLNTTGAGPDENAIKAAALGRQKQFGYGIKADRATFEQQFRTDKKRYQELQDKQAPTPPETNELTTLQGYFGPGGKYANYHAFRDLGKVNKFAHRRKAESATLNAIEATGHALDATGTFTAGADFGATKLTGKALKAGSASYKAVKDFGKRAARVHKLRQAKNLAGYGGRSDRGFFWGAKTFFGGNVERQQKHMRKLVNAGATQTPNQTKDVTTAADLTAFNAAGNAPATATGRGAWFKNTNTQRANRWDKISALAAAKNAAKYGGKDSRGAGWKLKQFLKGGTTPDEMAANFGGVTTPGAGQGRVTQQGKAINVGDSKSKILHKITSQGRRRAEGLINALENVATPDVRSQAQQTYKILAETNLAGAINRGIQGGLTDADFNMADPETRKAIKKLFLMQTQAY